MLQDRNVEVDQQARFPTAQLQVCEQLGFMDGLNGCTGLYLNHHGAGDEEIEAVSAVELCSLLLHRQRTLPLEWNPPQPQFPAQTFLVGRLEQPRSQFPMHVDGAANDLLCYSIQVQLCGL